MLTAREIMSTDLITITPHTEITQAARLLLDKHVNGLPVLDEEGRLVGIVCQSDLIAQQKKLPIPSFFSFLDGVFSFPSLKQFEKEVHKIAATKVSGAMTPNPVAVSPETGLEAMAALMVDNSFHTLPVVEEGRLIGVVGKEDILRTLMSATPQQSDAAAT